MRAAAGNAMTVPVLQVIFAEVLKVTNVQGGNTSSVATMQHMFHGNSAFNQLIGNWDTSSVMTIIHMFRDKSAFDQPIGTLDTSSVATMEHTLRRSSAFHHRIGTWDTSGARRRRMVSAAWADGPSLRDVGWKDSFMMWHRHGDYSTSSGR